MATGGDPLPRRLSKSNSIKRDASKSSIEILEQMGFSKQRAAKALAATGDIGVQLAADWLLSHVNDPTLDKDTPRQYILYLCPVGQLLRNLMEFYEKSLATCGWNGSHSYLPHITLCPFFTVEDNKVGSLKTVFEALESKLQIVPGPLKLDFFTQTNFIGLFLQENYYKYFTDIITSFASEAKKVGLILQENYFKYLTDIITLFASGVKKVGINVEMTKKQLHMTLAYQYSKDHHEELTKLAKQIQLDALCQWEMRLYSRDARIGNSEVRKVIKEYKADLDDELDLIMGDYVFMDPNETSKSEDGWYNGTSWLTGTSGMFPGTFTQRTAEMRAWSLHSVIELSSGTSHIPNGTGAAAPGPCPQTDRPPLDVYDQLWNQQNVDDMYAKVDKKRGSADKKRPRQLFVIRHGERVDFVYGGVWVDKSFKDDGTYTPIDLNMPKTLPRRVNHLDYFKDSPLTHIGSMQAFMTGEALHSAGVSFRHVYVSPSLRCVQTATSILKALGQTLPLHIEPGIFEWLGWYQMGLPKWFTPTELKTHGFNIDTSYQPFVTISQLDLDEDIAGYYKRSGDTAKKILKKHEHEGGNLLILGHAGSVEVITRQALGKTPRTSQEFRQLCSKVPYCGLFMCQEDPKTKKWMVMESPILPLTHGANKTQIVKDLLYPS